MGRQQVVLIDDHVLFRSALRALLASHDIDVVAEAGDALAAVELARKHPGAIVLLDVVLSDGRDGMRVGRAILEENPAARVVFMTSRETSDTLLTAVSIGAAGFVPKTTEAEQLFAAIDAVAAGGFVLAGGSMAHLGAGLSDLKYRPGALGRLRSDLSEREYQVLQLLATSRTYAQIAGELHLSRKTVEHYVTSLYRKLEVKNRQQAITVAADRGMLESLA